MATTQTSVYSSGKIEISSFANCTITIYKVETIQDAVQSVSFKVQVSTSQGTWTKFRYTINISIDGNSYTTSGDDYLSSIGSWNPGFSKSITDANRSENIVINSFSIHGESGLYTLNNSFSTAKNVKPTQSLTISYFVNSKYYSIGKATVIPTHKVTLANEKDYNYQGYYNGPSWNTKSDFSGTSYPVNTSMYINENTSLYSDPLIPINYYLELINENSLGVASEARSPEKITYDSDTNIPTFEELGFTVREGYSLSGWSKTKGSSYASYKDGSQASRLTTVPDDTVTLYTTVSKKSYKLNFDINYETDLDYSESPINKSFDTSIGTLKSPLRETSYEFDGWWRFIPEDNDSTLVVKDSILCTINNGIYNRTYKRQGTGFALCCLVEYPDEGNFDLDKCWHGILCLSRNPDDCRYYFEDITNNNTSSSFGEITYNEEVWYYSGFEYSLKDKNYVVDSSGLTRPNISKLFDEVYEDITVAVIRLLDLYYLGLKTTSSFIYDVIGDITLKAGWKFNSNRQIKTNDEWKPYLPYCKVNGEWKRIYPLLKNKSIWNSLNQKFLLELTNNKSDLINYSLVDPYDLYYRTSYFVSGYDYGGCSLDEVTVSDNYNITKDQKLLINLLESNWNGQCEVTEDDNIYQITVEDGNESFGSNPNILTAYYDKLKELSSGPSSSIIPVLNVELDSSSGVEGSATIGRNGVESSLGSVILDGKMVKVESSFSDRTCSYIALVKIYSSIIDIDNSFTLLIEPSGNYSNSGYERAAVITSYYDEETDSVKYDTYETTTGSGNSVNITLRNASSFQKLDKSKIPYSIGKIDKGYLSFLIITGNNLIFSSSCFAYGTVYGTDGSTFSKGYGAKVVIGDYDSSVNSAGTNIPFKDTRNVEVTLFEPDKYAYNRIELLGEGAEFLGEVVWTQSEKDGLPVYSSDITFYDNLQIRVYLDKVESTT